MSDLMTQPAGNFYDKYGTKNLVARRLMEGFLHSFDGLVSKIGTGRALEIGCGEGELSIRLAKESWAVEGCDIAPKAITEALKRSAAAGLDIPFSVSAIQGCVGNYTPADLVVCCEVLEHLEDPLGALLVLERLSKGFILVSVPREPIWRILNLARMHYIKDWGNTPGHVQHWSRSQFIAMLETRFDVLSVQSPLPWTMALCRVRD